MHYGASEDTQKQSLSSLMIERLLFCCLLHRLKCCLVLCLRKLRKIPIFELNIVN